MSIETIVTVVCAGLCIERHHLTYSSVEYLQARTLAVQLCVDYGKNIPVIRDELGISLDQVKSSIARFKKLSTSPVFMKKYVALKKEIERRAA